MTSQRYVLEGRIATGGMGEVWQATDTVLDREVAVKLLKAEYADDPTFRARFESEARHAAALQHPHVAAVFDFGEMPADASSDHARPYLVMELVGGRPLSDLLRPGEPMPPDQAADLVAQAADAIAAAHALGIVHRDVKPGNLLVTPAGQVKITDFGIARAADAATMTRTGQVIGTPQYLSPEQAEGRPATAASDVYSLGVVLYECLAGHRPFERETSVATALAQLRDAPPPLPDTVPVPLREAVARALEKRPEDRFASAAELATALRTSSPAEPAVSVAPLGDDAPSTRVMTVPPRGESRRRAMPGWLPWAVALAGIAVVLLVVALAGNHGAAPPPAAGRTPSATPHSPTSGPSVRTVAVAAASYVGRPASEATKELQALGLRVRPVPQPNDGSHAPGTVASVSPTGRVPDGGTVTLGVWGKAPPKPPGHGHHGKHKAHGQNGQNGQGNDG